MKQLSVRKAVLVGGAIAGVLDILFAIAFAAYNGGTPVRLLQTVASGAFGNAAFSGGGATAALGLVFHFALSYLWAVLFLLVAWRIPRIAFHSVRSGMIFGIIVFLAMRLVVLPLSAFPRSVTFQPLATAVDLLSHMFLFGVLIAVFVGKAVARGHDNSFKRKPLRGPA
jgi:uncharacterized membrane protein YagU involved in acid resistance